MIDDGQSANGNGDIRFYEAIIPPLEDGDYTLIATQTLSELPGPDPSPKIDPVTLEFSVRGPRFTLSPADIHAVFPAPGAPTPYEGQIPHVVVTRRTLPWERLLATDQARGIPWLGLLTIDEDDPGGIPQTTSGTVGDLLNPPVKTIGPAIKEKKTQSGESLDDRGLYLEDGQSLADPCTFIDVPAGLLVAIAPRVNELPFLAHARGVDIGNKPIEGIVADGIYSILIGNRVVHASKLNAAFLVSFEGFEELLNTGAVPSGVATVRLAVLTSWTFQMGGDDPFDALMSAGHAGLLAVQSPQVAANATGTPTRQPIAIPRPDPKSPTFAEDTVSYALQSGYAALAHHMREGDQTFSWYRGPLIPHLLELVLNADLSSQAFRTADELLRYDPLTGLFDTSYAAAFQLGRLLALQNEAFLTSLRTYLHQVRGQGFRHANRSALVLAQRAPLKLDAAGPEHVRNGAILDATVHWLAVNGAAALRAAVAGDSGASHEAES